MRNYLLLVVAWSIAIQARGEVTAVEVLAGEWNRTECLVHFSLPAFKNQTLGLRARSGAVLPLQVDGDGVASFVLPSLAKGKTKIFKLVIPGPPIKRQVIVVQRKDKLRFSSNGTTLMEYQAEPGALPREDIKKVFARGG